jgi:hypothetical protein
MTSRIRRLEKAYDTLIPDGIQHDTPHTLDRSELMRGASRYGSEITYHVQGQVKTAPRQTEVDGLKAAAGLERPEEPAPLIDVPNRYTNLKRCAYKDHVGDRWVNRSQFSADKAHVDGLHAYCRKCRAAQAKFAYVPRWRRGV